MAFSVLLGFTVAVFVWAFFALGEADALRDENERLRLFNARRERRLHKPMAIPRWDSINKASHVLGTDPFIIASVWRQENGPPDIETGSIGKTDFFAQNLPMYDWPAFEAGRTLNRLAWEWLTQTPEGRAALKPMLVYASKPYTALGVGSQKTWAKNVLSFQAKYRKEGSHGKN